MDPILNDCDENAICSNMQLSFTCTCREGFADAGHPGGAGRNCRKEDEGNAELVERIVKIELFGPKIAELRQSSKERFHQWSNFSIAGMVIGCAGSFLFVGLGIFMLLFKKRHSYREEKLYGEA